MFFTTERRGRAGSRFADGAPDLMVEVVSKDSVTRDTRDKFSEYESAGVREYWLIDSRPGQHIAQFYVLDEGRFIEVMPDELGIYRSTVLEGFWLDTAWLWGGTASGARGVDGDRRDVACVGDQRLLSIVRTPVPTERHDYRGAGSR